MRTICISALKGGVAKSTTSLSLAYVAANEFHKKTLLIDMDQQSSSSILVGVTPNNYDKRTPFDDIPKALEKLKSEDLTYDIDYMDGFDSEGKRVSQQILDAIEKNDDYESELKVNGIHTIFDEMMEMGKKNNCIPSINKPMVDKCIHKPYYTLTEKKVDANGKAIKDKNGKIIMEKNKYSFGFDIIPSTEYLSDILLMWDRDHMGEFNYMKRGKQLKMVIDFIAKNYDYDFCVIDCAPSLDLTTANALFASDAVIISASQDKQSLYSLKRIKRNIKTFLPYNNEHFGVAGIVLTIFNERRSVDKYISMTVGKDLGLHVFKTKISETNDAKKAILSGLILPQINARNYNESCELFKEINKQIDFLAERKLKIKDTLLKEETEKKLKKRDTLLNEEEAN